MKKKISVMLCGVSLAMGALFPMDANAAAPAESVPAVQAAAQKSVSPTDANGFVLLSEAVPDIIQEIRYYSTYNFVGDHIDGYEEPCALMTREAAEALKAVSDDLMKQGYRLKVYDAYRPQRAVDHFVRWAENLSDKRMMSYFYPEVDKTRLFADGYIDAKSGHSRGSTLDLTLFDMATGKEVDMGGTFDHFGIESHPDWCGNPETGEYTGKYAGDETPEGGEINETQFQNRMLLRRVMMRHGFRPIDTEWWHFTLKGEPYPDTYFNFPVRRLP
ncbi:MAG: M15 family metallopeptidase [Schwartzia sp.]|nr:M15 family metallopeptidase [Schwartzia sp. (in: firmicutes)]